MPPDAIDLRILCRLRQDGQMSSQDLAEKVSLSSSAYLHRSRLLENERIVRGYPVGLDVGQLDAGLEAIVHVSLRQDAEGQHEAFIARVRDQSEVVTTYVVTGITSCVLRARTRNLEHYPDFIMNKLSRTTSVTDIHSEIVLQEIKAGTDLLSLTDLKN